MPRKQTKSAKQSRAEARRIDGHVGGRLRNRRRELSLSQVTVAEYLDVTFQQVQKYESGRNRIGASRLSDLSKILKVPVEYFFEGLEKTNEDEDAEVFHRDDIVILVGDYTKIPSQERRAKLSALIRAVAREHGGIGAKA